MNTLKAISDFLELTDSTRSKHTARTYSTALIRFLKLTDDCGNGPVNELTLEPFKAFMSGLKSLAPATEQVYIVAVSRLYQYLVAEELTDVNLEKMKMLISTRSRRPGARLPQFPKEAIERVIQYAEITLDDLPSANKILPDQLKDLRDATIILVLADTGLRIHELCELTRGNLNWRKQRAVIIGKGNTEAVIRFSKRSTAALKRYTSACDRLLDATERPLTAPVFARHNTASTSAAQPITTATGRVIVDRMSWLPAWNLMVGEDSAPRITPHSFRHYFVTNVLDKSGGNLKLAQELARHKNIQVTQRYAHLSDADLDNGYSGIFDKENEQ